MARPTLQQLGVPDPFSGVCVHATPACEGDTFQDPVQAKQYVDYLWNHGVGGVKTFGSTTKQEIAHQAVLKGMLPMHRWWRGHRIGAPDYCTPDAEIAQYVAVGCKIQELHNEPNLADEWDEGPYHGLPPYNQIPNILWTDWLKFADACNRCGAYALFPALSPGGNWEHRDMLNALLEWGIQHNYMGRVQDNVIAQHPRGHNFDRDVLYSPTMTCSWDEYRRNIQKFKEAGADTWHIATEWGWSLGNQADPARPRVDLPFWYEQNRETWMRMNPNSDKPVEYDMLALCYWIQGDPTDWPQDSIDQGRLDMPAPSPLWVDMEQHPEWYRWSRYGNTAGPLMPGVTDLRATLPRNGPYPQRALNQIEQIVIHHSGPPGWLPGVKADEYARRIAQYHVGLGWPGIGYTFVVGAQGMICQCAELADVTNHVYNQNTPNLAICLLGDFRADKNGQPPGTQIAAANAVVAWLRERLGNAPVVGHKDLDRATECPGDTWDTWKLELDLAPPEPEEPTVRIFDITGTERDWAWVEATYGGVEILPADGYNVIELREVEGIMAFRCTLLSEAGAPVVGQQVAYVTPTQEYIETTTDLGIAEHIAGPGEGYWPPGPGVISWYVKGAASDRITGLGWLLGSNHRHLQVTMQLQGDIEPPDEDQLDRIEAKVNAIWELLNSN